MKVLVVSTPGAGHLRPLMPLIEALLALGDAVTIAAADDARDSLGDLAAEFVPVGHGEDAWFGTLMARTRGMPGAGLPAERINHYFVPRLFADIAAADMADDTIAVARELAPDVVLSETYAMAGPLAAAVAGIPHVHHLISPMLPSEIMALAADALSPLWRSFGLDYPPYAGLYDGITIEIAPPILETRRVPSGESVRMRPVTAATREPADPALVWVTLGTFFNANVGAFRTMVDALDGEPVEAIVTVGRDADPHFLGAVPANVEVTGFVPQGELLPRCSAVVHHGGSGTMLAAVAHGVAQVVVPQGADNFLNGDVVAAAGVGRVLAPQASAHDIRSALRALLADPEVATATVRGAAEVAAMPTPQQVAALLHERFG